MPQHRFLLGDAEKALSTLPDNAVQLVVTSPPYGTLKDYGFGRMATASLRRHLNRHGVDRVCPCAVAGVVSRSRWRPIWRSTDGNGKYQIVPIHADIIAQFLLRK